MCDCETDDHVHCTSFDFLIGVETPTSESPGGCYVANVCQIDGLEACCTSIYLYDSI